LFVSPLHSYALVLAATLLTGGRLADMWSSKIVFITGFFALGIFSLTLGFVKNKVGFLILRAFSAFGGSLTIPAATK
jgi:MFS family permease